MSIEPLPNVERAQVEVGDNHPNMLRRTTRPRVVLVGCGRRFTSALGPVLREMGAYPVAVVDPARGARDRVMEVGFSLDRTTVAANMVDLPALHDIATDAVIIASPSGLHFEHAMISLSSSIPTFIEKPLACTSSQARRLRSFGPGSIAGSEQRIHRADLKLLQWLIESGRIGRLRRIDYLDVMTPAPAIISSWRNDMKLAGGGVLLDLGYHTVGAIQWLLGTDTSDFAVTYSRLSYGSLQVEDRVDACWVSGNVEIWVNIRLSSERPREVLTAKGTLGELRIERERRGSQVSTVNIRIAGRSGVTMRLPLTSTYDTKSLRDFMLGAVDSSQLTRHVQILTLLDQIYARANGGSSSSCG
ncbi:MAG: Gfo/Idh/MocA family protein [Gammaproteobacteria bacterium]